MASMTLLGTPLEAPVHGAVAAHIDHRKCRIDLTGAAGHLPTIQLVAAEIDVGH